jgi:hypothetical protein
LNISAIRDSVARSTEVKILLDAGVPCRVEVEIAIDSTGNYRGHKYISSCHPLAKVAIDRYVKLLKFSPKIVNGNPENATIVTYFRWTTW